MTFKKVPKPVPYGTFSSFLNIPEKTVPKVRDNEIFLVALPII